MSKRRKLVHGFLSATELDALFWNSTKQEISMYTVLLLPEGSPSTYSLPVIGVHGTVGITVNNGKVS